MLVENIHSSSDLRSGGQFPAMRTSLALPDRRDFRVVFIPIVTEAKRLVRMDMDMDMYVCTGRHYPPLPDFMTTARRELRVSLDFFALAIFAANAVDELTRPGLFV